MSIELGAPTEYGFSLPKIRYDMTIPFLIPGNILDYGCGNGANSVLFAGLKEKLYGIEVEKERLNEGIQYAISNNINIEYMVYDGIVLPFDDNSLSNVISYEVIEHTQDDALALADIYRVLKKKGRFICTVPNKRYIMETHGFHGWIAKYIPTNRILFLSWLPTCIHERWANARIYSKTRYYKLLKDAGFTILYHEYLMPPLDKVKNKYLKKILLGIISFIKKTPLKILGVSHFIVCQK